MLRDFVLGTGTQNLIFDLAAIFIKLGLLLTILILFQRFYTKISKNSAEGHPEKTILIFRAILSSFALVLLALNWLPWLYTETGALNAYDIIVNQGQYLLLIPLLVMGMMLIQTWNSGPNAPASVAILLSAYAISVAILGLPSRVYASAIAIGPAWLSLIVAGIAVFPAILYAEGMPHPTSRLLYKFINLGKVSYDEAVHHAAQSLLIRYQGSAVPLGFSAAEGEYQGKRIRIFGSEGNISSKRIVGVMTATTLAVDDIIVNRPDAWPEVYLAALGVEVPSWYDKLLDDETWEPPVEHIELEIGGVMVTDDYEIASTKQSKALEIVKLLREEIIDLDADFMAMTAKGVYVGYDFSRMRMPEEFLLDKTELQLKLLAKLEKTIVTKKPDKKPEKQSEKKSAQAQEPAKAKGPKGKQAEAEQAAKKQAKGKKKPPVKSSN